MEIRSIQNTEMPEALDLVWRVFLEFEAPDYTEEGVKEFKTTIEDEAWIKARKFFGAFEDGKIVGVIATKEDTHIALFFVDGKSHGQGIGRKLYDFIATLNPSKHFTVNSSPYAKDIYHHMGFQDLSEEQCIHGLRFIPMECDFN